MVVHNLDDDFIWCHRWNPRLRSFDLLNGARPFRLIEAKTPLELREQDTVPMARRRQASPTDLAGSILNDEGSHLPRFTAPRKHQHRGRQTALDLVRE